MAALTVQDGSNGIQSLALSAATGGGDTIAGGSRTGGWSHDVALVVLNLDAAAKTVTVNGVGYVVPATGSNNNLAIIPVNSGVHGQVRPITYSAVTSLWVAAVRLHAAV